MTHIVSRGETLGGIAKTYGVALTDLVSVNVITDPNKIYVGQVLTIPTIDKRTADLLKKCINNIQQMPEFIELERILNG